MAFLFISTFCGLVLSTAQEASQKDQPTTAEWRLYFPCEVGDKWLYEDDLGRTVTTQVVSRNSFRLQREGYRIVTWGLKLGQKRTASTAIGVKIHKEGIGIHRLEGNGSVGWLNEHKKKGPLHWVIKAPLKAGESWSGRQHKWGLEGIWPKPAVLDVRHKCEGIEKIGWKGKWLKAIRVTWAHEDAGITTKGTTWYAPRLGPVKQRLRVTSDKQSSELTWTLREFHRDPAQVLYKCSQCAFTSVSKGVCCNEKEQSPYKSDLGRLIDGHIQNLDSERVAARELAEEELGRIGEVAHPALRRALEGASVEMKTRLERLLSRRD